MLETFLMRIKKESLDWCKGKSPSWRFLILLLFAYMFIRYLFSPDYTSLLSPLNLGIHELGHLVFSFFGNFLAVLGGTLLQVIVPVFSVINFYWQRDFFAIALSFGWLSTSFFDAARYIGDARAMSLPLVSPFGAGDTIHDWNYLLNRMGLLKFDIAIASIVKFLAFLSMLVCFSYGAWLLRQMRRAQEKEG